MTGAVRNNGVEVITYQLIVQLFNVQLPLYTMAMMMLNSVGRGSTKRNLCGVRENDQTRVSLTSTLTPTNFGESNAFRMLLELLTYMTRKQSCESSARVVAACVEH